MPDKITKCFLGPSNKLLPESDRIHSRPTGKSEITTDMCAECYEDTTCPTFYERLYRCVVQYVALNEFEINLLLYRASQQLNDASSISVPLVSTVSAWCIVRKKMAVQLCTSYLQLARLAKLQMLVHLRLRF